MNIDALKAELLAGHPGPKDGTPTPVDYDDNAEVAAAQGNEINRWNKLKSMTGTEILNAADYDEGEALSPADKDRYWRIIDMGSINPWGHEATIMIDIFGGTSLTIQSLKALRKVPCSRANEEDRDISSVVLGKFAPGNVLEARA